MSNPTTEAQTKRVLDQDAFALALRLYIVVTVLVILLALAGLAANLAVQLPARRRDAASLRVVGVKRRAVMVGVVAEFVVVLGPPPWPAWPPAASRSTSSSAPSRSGFVDSSLVPRVRAVVRRRLGGRPQRRRPRGPRSCPPRASRSSPSAGPARPPCARTPADPDVDETRCATARPPGQ